jgi:two-component system OmpR family sensor kinase
VFLPLALLAAAGGGLFAFRLVVRRLRRLEALAGRVAEGDFSARVAEGQDEIGRLGQRLNQMAASLGEARERDLANDRTRRRLLADISHELATPLTTIRGYTETLLDPDVPVDEKERTDYLQAVKEEARRMDLLLADLFELTRLEAGAIGLHPEPLDLADLVRNMVDRFEPRFREGGLALSFEGPLESAPLTADGRRLEQVFLNLLGNALRYVPRGGHVWVRLRPGEEPDRTGVCLEVADDGPGIPPADLPHVFDRFYRGDPSRPAGGSGLGLAIVRELVAGHGGRVEAANRPEGGAIFRVRLPEAPPADGVGDA